MADNSDEKRPLTLGGRPSGKLEMRKPIETGSVRQSFPHGRSKTVQVEVRRKRATPGTGLPERPETASTVAKEAPKPVVPAAPSPTRRGVVLPHGLTPEEAARRARALKGALKAEEQAAAEARAAVEREQQLAKARPATPPPAETPKVEARNADEQRAEQRKVEQAAEISRREVAKRAGDAAAAKVAALSAAGKVKIVEEEEDDRARRPGAGPKRPAIAPRRDEPKQRSKLTVTRALNEEGEERTRSESQFRRQREREKQRLHQLQQADAQVKQAREVVIPETITVQELANRMAEQGAKVVKKLFDMGVMATITQNIDADTAELIATEFGNKVRRVSEADVEVGLVGEADAPETLKSRPPVVTVMGHVDHGKTSLLDALRSTDVASGEAGGITQHIGAYQVALKNGQRITFIDTPGHQAFTAMRARGAQITDIVVLVVAADDGIKEQTVEAIRHAREAKVPMIVAINKVDKPDAKPERVRQDLLQHEVVLEHLGGEVLDVEVSATKKINLEKLEEIILLQAEVLDLKANPDRPAEGSVIEAKLERGRGSVATVLIKRGTLKTGDIFVAGSEWGRVRALIDDRGQTVNSAG
ncbi:MAG: translation initiation factor IF-2, partial [Stellaceae bacterium]